MTDQAEIEAYNYATFVGDDKFLDFRTVLPVGTLAPDVTLTLLETEQPVRLSDYWREQDVLIEFGSLTWPYCSLAAPALEPMAREYADKGFGFVFVYTREAHPGERYPAHRGMEQKLAHARTFRKVRGIQRPILVDDLVGTGHKLYGCLPNMTYLVGRGGKVLARADWTDPPSIRFWLDYVLAARARRREGLKLGPFYMEMVGYRWSDVQQFRAGLEFAGPQAVDDYDRAVQGWQRQGPRPGRIQLEEGWRARREPRRLRPRFPRYASRLSP